MNSLYVHYIKTYKYIFKFTNSQNIFLSQEKKIYLYITKTLKKYIKYIFFKKYFKMYVEYIFFPIKKCIDNIFGQFIFYIFIDLYTMNL